MPPSTAVLESSTQNDVSNEAFPYMTTRFIDIAGVSVWAQRISYTGELGWELYIPWEDGLKVWDAFMNAGESCGVQPFGYKALDTLRIEKGYLYWSGDITPVDNPFEAGLGFCVDLDKDNFIVRETLRTIKKSGPKTKLSAIALDANYGLFGGKSVYSSGKLVDRIRSAAYGHTIGKDIGLIYLPLVLAKSDTQVEVEVMGERVKAEVAQTPMVDPEGERIRS